MPENQAALAAAPPLWFDDEDDGFGDFKFSSFGPSPSPPFPLPTASPKPREDDDDDDWGEFVATPPPAPPLFDPSSDASPANSDPVPSMSAGLKPWEKPRGALPLSIFGDEEEEAEDPKPLDPQSLFGDHKGLSSSAAPSARNGILSGSGEGLADMIANLYTQAGAVVAHSDLDGDSWEFMGASPAETGVKKEEPDLEIASGLEKDPAGSDDGIQGSIVSHRAGDQKNHHYIFVTHERITNGLNYSLTAFWNHQILDTHRQTEDAKTRNGLPCHLNNGDMLSEIEVVTHSFGEQLTGNTWKDNLCDAPISHYQHKQEDAGGHFLDKSGLPLEPNTAGNGIKSTGLHSDVFLTEITSNLYNKFENGSVVYNKQDSLHYTDKSLESAVNSVIANDDNDTDEFEWEFQMASEERFTMQNSVLKADQNVSADVVLNSTTNAQKLPEYSLDSVHINAVNNSDDIDWEFQMVSEETLTNQNFAYDKVQHLSMDSTQNNLLHAYFRLKELSILLVVHHLIAFGDLKKAHGVALSGEQAKAVELNEEIQAAYKKLQQDVISGVYMGECPSKQFYVNQLSEVIREPHFQPFAKEYGLSERISSAVENLSTAISLVEHATSVLCILGLASLEEQKTYIITWSKIAQACVQELEHGAKIWEDSLAANVCAQILSRGKYYFIALGEIYHVAELLRASLKLYKPWILANQLDSSEVLICLEKCSKAWMTSGLKKALNSIVSSTDLECASMITVLLETIGMTHNLDDDALLGHLSCDEKIFCRLSLLPIGVLQDVRAVVWNGEHYFLKLANLWANFISCNSPQLPQICFS